MSTSNRPADPRAVSILAKSLYRELRSGGYATSDVISLAGELLGMITNEVRTGAEVEEEEE